jgi:endonuclease/exonuclease/phosphatase family metal-dependent hydrolase
MHQRHRVLARALPLAILCAIGMAFAGRDQDAPLTVMSFNIRYGLAEDGENRWPHRADLVVETIAAAAPDILALQEALRFQLDELGDALPGYGEIGVGRDDGIESGEYAAILYRRDRLHPIAYGTFWLSDTPDVPGSTSWGNRITRICTWARFSDVTGGPAFTVYNVHFDHESQPSRLRSAELVMQRIHAAEGDRPVIVLGDFNAGESNPARQVMAPSTGARGDPERAVLLDTYRVRHPVGSGEGTFNGFTGDASGERIDAILISPGWTVLSASIVHAERNGRYPSDHFPVTAVLRHGSSSP